MKRTGTVLDMENDRAVMFNKSVKLDFTSSGHYCVNIMDKDNKNIQVDEQVLATTEDMSKNKHERVVTTAEADTLKENEDRQCEDEILTISDEMSCF